VGFEK